MESSGMHLERFELSRPPGQRSLNPLRLPIPPQVRHVQGEI